jgi:hypothetical protein
MCRIIWILSTVLFWIALAVCAVFLISSMIHVGEEKTADLVYFGSSLALGAASVWLLAEILESLRAKATSETPAHSGEEEFSLPSLSILK